MFNLKTSSLRFASVLAISSTLLASLVATAADDFGLASLPSFDAGEIHLADKTGTTFYDFMRKELGPKMNGQRQSSDVATLLRQGKGVAVRLNADNVSVHVNYYNDPLSGRSYGWSHGLVGDWSDKKILLSVSQVAKGSDSELKNFYTALVQMVGNCDPSGVGKLRGMSERVATNFIAIYGAEAFRATLNGSQWDDALFEAMMIAAFHGGQSTFTKYYSGKFSTRSFKQAPGVYDDRGAAPVKPSASSEQAATLIDYWQFTSNPAKKNSGINLTRGDFEKMGETITAFEQGNADLHAIETIVKGSGKNVIKDITQYFARGKASASATNQLAAHVASFLVKVRADANKITAFAAGAN